MMHALRIKLTTAWAVFRKDVQLELKDKHAINTVFVFVSAALLIVLFVVKAQRLPTESQAGLIWIIILFAAMSSLSRAFVLEADKQTYALLRLHANAFSVFMGKLLYNFLFTLIVNFTSILAFIFLLGLSLHNGMAFLVSVILGSSGLAGVSTLLSALVAEADRKGAIFSVLSIPLLVPLLLLVSNTTEAAMAIRNILSLNDVAALIGYTGVTMTAGLLLYDFVWDQE